MSKNRIKEITVVSVMGALGFILMALEFPISFLIPSFVKFDFSELPALITSFALGPIQGVLVCLIKNLLHLALSSSAGVGELSNFILGAIFTSTAGVIYRFNKSRKGALLGCISGAAAMAVVSVASNYFIVYPFYTALMPEQAIVSAYRLLLPFSDTLLKCLLIFNMPFTFFKGLVDTAICFLIYKRISHILH